MVAFFAGLGVGLERGSAAALGAGGVVGGGLQGRGGDAVSINARTGNLMISRQDEFLVGRGPDAAIGRTYNSHGGFEENGDHWRIHDDRRILGLTGAVNTAGSTVRRISADGSDITFTYAFRAGRWSYWTTDGGGAHDELQFASNQWTYIAGGSDIRETYEDASGGWWRLRQQIDTRSGDALTYSYSGGLLHQVTTADGGWVRYDWTGANLSQIVTGFLGQQRTSTTYAYDGHNRLSHVHVNMTRTDGLGGGTYTTQYHYHGASRLVSNITQTDGSNVYFGYDSVGRVTYIANHPGDGSSRVTQIEYHHDRTDIIDARGGRTILHHNAAGQLTSVLDPVPVSGAGHPTTSFQYDSDGNLVSTTSATGGVSTFAYDDRGNVLTATDATGRLTTSVYDAASRLVAQTAWGTRGNGSSHPLTSRFVYNAQGQLEFEVSPEGRVTQYAYHGNGLVYWKRHLTGYQYNPGSTNIPTAAEMHNWHAAVGVNYQHSTLEEYRYDGRGEVTEIVRWGMPHGNGGWNGSEGYSHTYFVRDRSGRVIQQHTAPESASSFVYDGLGRVVVKVDPASGTTSIVFNDAATQTVVTDGAGYTVTSTFNKLGELLSQSDGGDATAGGTSQYLYDRNGNLRRTIDGTGRAMYHLWDRAGRKVADIAAEGSMTEYRYDAAGRLTGTGRYTHWAAHHVGTLNDPAAELEIHQVRPPAHPYDVWEWTVYDQAGRVVQTILGDGSTTRYQYDGAGRLVTTIGHVNKLSVAGYLTGPAPATPVVPPPHGDDTYARSFHDGDGLLIGTLAPDGGLTRIEYDGKGRRIAEHRFVHFTDPNLRAAGTFEQLLHSIPKDAALDVTRRWVYDGQDQLRYEIDGAGRVTEYRYWEGVQWYSAGRPRRVIQHAVALAGSVADFSYPSVQAHMAPHVAHGDNRNSYQVYNANGTLAFSVDAAGQVTHFVHDGAGRTIRTLRYGETVNMAAMGHDAAWLGNLATWAAARTAGARIERHYYSARGELRATIDAEGFVTQFHHDAEGRVTQQDRFSARVHPEDWWTVHTVYAVGKGSAVTRYFGHDGLGRQIETIDENGNRTWYGYFHNGLKAWHIEAAWQEGESRTHFIYDQAGRLKHEIVTSNELETYGWHGNSSTTQLHSRHRLISPNWAYQLGLSAQGELQVYHHGNLIWSNGVRDTITGATYTLDAQHDGNLVIYRHQPGHGPVGIWSSNTSGTASGPTFITMQDDGNFVLYRGTPSGNQGGIWSTGTHGQTGSGPGSWLWTKNYHYNGLGQVTAVHDAQGVHTHYTYDRAGNLIREVDGVGAMREYGYNAAGQMTWSRNANGHTAYRYYDRTGRQIAALDEEGYLTRTHYNGFGEVASQTRFYNRAWGPYHVGHQPGLAAHGLDATTHYAYDRLGRVTVVTDAEGHQELFQYNAFGQRSAIRNKLGGWTHYSYDRRGLLVQEQLSIDTFLPGGARQSWHIHNNFEYDSRGNMTRRVEAAGLAEERNTWYDYDAGNRLVAKRGDTRFIVASGTDHGVFAQPVEQYRYDRRGNVIEVIAPDGRRTLRWFNLQNQVTHELSNGGSLTRHFYAPDGMLVETRTYGDRVALPANARGMPPAGGASFRSTRYVYDAINRVIETRTGPVHTAQMTGDTLSVQWRELVTAYQYDHMGNVTRTTDADGHHIHAWHDRTGRKVTEIDQSGFRTDWTHDANGNVVSERRQAVSTWNVHHTADDRVTTFAYDRMGRRTVLHRHNVLVHDGAGNHVTGQSHIYYAYNGLGQVTWKTEATGEWTANTYDAFGRLVQQHKSAVATVEGVGNAGLTYNYDGLGNLVRTHQWGWGGTAGRTSEFTYGKGGLLEFVRDASGFVRKYVHDGAGRVTREEYHRHQHWVGTHYEATATDYDADGRVSATGKARWTGAGWTRGGGENDTRTMLYNAWGELSQRGINGHFVEEFQYDSAGRLYRSNAGDGVTRYFVHDGRGNQTVMIASEGMDIRGQSLDWALDRWGGDRNAIRHHFVDGVTATITRFDARGLATEVIEPQRELHSNHRQHLHTHRGYTAFGEVAWEQDARGNRIDYAYNTMGRQIRVESPHVTVTHANGTETWARPTEHKYYDAAGRLVAEADANGNLTRYTLFGGSGYDGTEALVTQVLYADGTVQHRGYDMFGDLRHINDRGRVTDMAYDGMGRQTVMVQAGFAQHTEYDGLGRTIGRWSSITGYDDRELYAYDMQGRITAHRAIGGDITWTGYVYNPGMWTPGGLNNLGGWNKSVTHANGRQTLELTDTFGRQIHTIDMGGHHSWSHYDLAGRLTYRDGGLAMNFTWLNTGKMRSQYIDTHTWSDQGQHTARRETWYHYDATGNVTHQATYRTGQEAQAIWVPDYWDYWNGYYIYNIVAVNETHENQSAQYDALGRITYWQEHGGIVAGAHSHYRYDAAGNVRRTLSTSWSLNNQGAPTQQTTQDFWYRYDSMNRVVTDKGTLEGGQIVRGQFGTDIFYNAQGDRATVLRSFAGSHWVVDPNYYDPNYIPPGAWNNWYNYGEPPEPGGYPGGYYVSFTGAIREDYAYDGAGRMTHVYQSTGSYHNPVPGQGGLLAWFAYDVAGRQTQQVDYVSAGSATVAYSQSTSYDAAGRVASTYSETRQGNDIIRTTTNYNYGGSWQGAAYALGQVMSVTSNSHRNWANHTGSTTTYNYAWYQGAVQQSINHTQTGSSAGNTWMSYNLVAGQAVLQSASISDGRARTVTYGTNLMGEVVRRGESASGTGGGAPTEYWYRFAGREMGKVGNDGQWTWSTAYAQSVGQRQTQAGQGAFQNGSQHGTPEADFGSRLDYANSYSQGSGAGTITARGGETLQQLASQLWGDAGLWYKLAQANGLGGDTTLIEGQTIRIPAGVMRNTFNASTVTPTDPNDTIGDVNPTTPQAAPPKRRRCGGLGALFLVVIAVAVTILTKGAAAKLAGAIVKGVVGSTAAATAAGVAATKVIGAGLAAAAGSIVSQAVGVATGIQEKFSWKSVGMAFISGGVGAGMAGPANAGILETALRGAASSAISQGIGVALGLQDRFSWAAVAAAGVGAAAGHWMGTQLSTAGTAASKFVDGASRALGAKAGGYIADTMKGMADAVAGAATLSIIEGTDFGDNLLAALPSVLGGTIAKGIVGQIQPWTAINPIDPPAANLAQAAGTSTATPAPVSLTPQQKQERVNAAMPEVRQRIGAAAVDPNLDQAERDDLTLANRALRRGDTQVQAVALDPGVAGDASVVDRTDRRPDGTARIRININSPNLFLPDGSVNIDFLAAVVVHEARHIHDIRFRGWRDGVRTIEQSRETERNAYRTQAAWHKSTGTSWFIRDLSGNPAQLTRANANIAAEASVIVWVNGAAASARSYNANQLAADNRRVDARNAQVRANNERYRDVPGYQVQREQPHFAPKPIPVYTPPATY